MKKGVMEKPMTPLNHSNWLIIDVCFCFSGSTQVQSELMTRGHAQSGQYYCGDARSQRR